MNSDSIFMGQDIGSLSAVCHLSTEQYCFTEEILTTAKGIKTLLKHVEKAELTPSKIRCVLEHCGHYGHQWAELLLKAGFKVSMVETTALLRVKGSHKRKDDYIDAKGLCEYGNRFHDLLSDYVPLSQTQKLLSELYNLYNLEKKAGAAKQQLLPTITHEQVKEHVRQGISEHKQRCKMLLNQVRQVIKSDPELKQKSKQLRTIPGVGEIITWKFLTRFTVNEDLDGRRLASWLGVAPGPNQSGKFKGKTKSSGWGNKDFRRLLHLGARSSVTHNPDRKAYYQRKLKQGKNKQVVINNVINKMLHVIAKIWNTHETFDPNYSQKFQQIA